MIKQPPEKQCGYALIAVIVILAIAGMALSGSLLQSAVGLRTMDNSEQRSSDYMEAEASIAKTISWLRKNSQSMVKPFRRGELYTHIRRVNQPKVGNNNTIYPMVPVKVLGPNANNAYRLVSDPSLGSGHYPPTENITTNTAFDAQAEFAAADFGNAMVQMTLVEVVAKEESKDYGNPPNAAPETDFYPVYRIDAVSSSDAGAHLTAYVKGNVINLFDMSFYGESYLELRQPCDSYNAKDGAYGGSNKLANCIVGSNSTAAVHKSENIYGEIKTNGDINAESPYGGEACADFEAGCPNKGETCAGEDCGVPLLEQFDTWPEYCPSNQGDLTISTDTTLTVASDDPGDRCWGTVTVGTGATLTLETTQFDYYFQNLVFQHNTSVIMAEPDDGSSTVTLFLLELDGDNLNGNQSVNALGQPGTFTIVYLGTSTLTLNGNADMQLALVAPNARIDMLGTFDFYGAILAQELNLSGNGSVHYDESLGGTGPVVNVQYKEKSLLQQYR